MERVFLVQRHSDRFAKVAIIADRLQILVRCQRLLPHDQITCVGWGQFEVEDHPVQAEQQVELVAEDCLLLGGHLAEGGTVAPPRRGTRRAGHQAKLDHRDRKAIDHRLAVGGKAKRPRDRSSDQVQGIREVTPSPIETALRGQARKEVAMLAEVTERLGLLIPPAVLPNDGQGPHLTARAGQGRTRTMQERTHPLPDLIDHDLPCTSRRR